jgi:hypothetical protein
MQPLLKSLAVRFPNLIYSPGKEFCWSPESQEIFYKTDAVSMCDTWSLLHETGHAVLGHQIYQADFELLQMEIAAWGSARQLARELAISINEDHIQDCLDTYRDWLYQRSVCPSCGSQCMQEADYQHYRCFNCHCLWRVSANRFARAYRKTLFRVSSRGL